MLDAAVELLKRGGASSITTNRIAETAGVSIGSVYQYFKNCESIALAVYEQAAAKAAFAHDCVRRPGGILNPLDPTAVYCAYRETT